MKIFFVRHGNTFETGEPSRYIGSRVDVPLTAKGREQAKAAGQKLKRLKCPTEAIYSGKQDRQRETAKIIREILAPQAIMNDRIHGLSEIDYGPWEGLTNDEIALNWPDEYAAWTEKGTWPAAIFATKEADARADLEAFLNEVTDARVGCAVAVTSQGVMRQLRRLIDGTVGDEAKVKPGNFCEIEIGPEGPKIVSWNVTP